MSEKILVKADFHPVLIHYFFLYVLGYLTAIVVSIPLVPFWLVLGYYFCRKYFRRLECVLKEQTLELKKGHLFRVEKTIPLDKIQDLTLRQGPLLRFFDLYMLDVETAGQSAPQGSSDAKIVGIMNAREFRDRVLKQRDQVVSGLELSGEQTVKEGQTTADILLEIKEVLQRIEKKLGN